MQLKKLISINVFTLICSPNDKQTVTVCVKALLTVYMAVVD